MRRPLTMQLTSEAIAPQEAYTEPGIVINTDRFDGMVSTDAKQAIVQYAQEGFWQSSRSVSATGLANLTAAVLGRSIPVIHCPSCGTLPAKKTCRFGCQTM